MATEELLTLKAEANERFKSCSYREAVALYDQCLLTPQDDNKLLAILHSNKAQCYMNLGEYKNAVESASQAIACHPSDTKALFRRAHAFEKLEQLAEALEDSRKLIRLEPNNVAAQSLIRRIESAVNSRVNEIKSLPGRINSMFDVVKEGKTKETTEQALDNLTSLIREGGHTPSKLIWNHSGFNQLYDFCQHENLRIVQATHRLMAHIIAHHVDRCMTILNTLTTAYFEKRILSRKSDEALEAGRFLTSVLEGLTQLKAYTKAKDAADLSTSQKQNAKVAAVRFPKYRLDESIRKPVLEILQHLFRVTNSYRLYGVVRDYLLEMLVRFVPSEKGVGCAKEMLDNTDNLERLLEVAAAAGTSAVTSLRSHRSRLPDGQAPPRSAENQTASIEKAEFVTTPNTRMTVACLIAKLWEDMNSDKARESFTNTCGDFILYLFSDPFLESKLDATSVIGSLFLGAYEVGGAILSRPGVLEGIFLLTQCANMQYQNVALDTIILATHKKEQCMNLISKAVPILLNLYKSPNDRIKIRSLVALCKFGTIGGSDVSIKCLTEGSTLNLMHACRRLLLGLDNNNPDSDLEGVRVCRQAGASVSESGQIIVEENSGSEDDGDDEQGLLTTYWKKKRGTTVSEQSDELDHMKDSNSVSWATEALAYLTMGADVKEEVVSNQDMIYALLHMAKLGLKESGFALACVLANLTNSLPKNEIVPEMVELAKFAKQHIPEQHVLDSPEHVTARRQRLVDAGLPVALYNLTLNVSVGPVGGNEGLRELISRIYLAICEEVSHRGKLVQAGAVKALLNLAHQSNTDAGHQIATQSLARLAITSDPRVTFPGQRSLELVRPLLRILSPDVDALPNFEALLALTNLASIDDRHRHRIMAERGIPLIDHYVFEDHPSLRRAAVECLTNMAQYHPFVVSCGGTLPIDNDELGSKLPYLSSNTECVRLLVLYCCEFEDLLLVRAAIGALAAMSYDPGIILRITKTASWFEAIQTLAGHKLGGLQHRATHLLRNLIVHGERSFAEYICSSNMLEVLMSLRELPDINSDDTLPPETEILNPGLSNTQLLSMNQIDRNATKRCAHEALSHLQQLGLVERSAVP